MKKVKEVVTGNGDESNISASNNDKETSDGWKWSNNEKQIKTPTIDGSDDNKIADERLNGEHLKVKNDITSVKSKIDSETKTQ